MTQPLDMPNEAGWWAFEGQYPNQKAAGDKPWQYVFRVNESSAGLTFTNVMGDDVPVTLLIGKWTRIYMPWEQQPTPEPGRYFFDGYRTNSSGNRARVQGWIDWPDDDGATYEGRWQPDTRLICQECNDYLEHPSYCETCFDTMKQAALEGMQPATVPDTVREVATEAIKYMLLSEEMDEGLWLRPEFRSKMEAALTWYNQQPQEGGE